MGSISQKFYVYTLARPNGEVFYVGKGSGNRLDHHEREARNGKQSYKCNVIRKVWAEGGQIIKQKVAFFVNEDEAYRFEQQLIAFMGRRALTNIADGGEGGGGRPQERDLSTFGRGLRIACEQYAKRMGLNHYPWRQLALDTNTKETVITKAVSGVTVPSVEHVWKWIRHLKPSRDLEKMLCGSIGCSTQKEYEEALARIDAMEQAEGIQ